MPHRKSATSAAFFLPVGLYLIVLLAARVTPFGDHTLLLWDADNFYVSFLSYWRGVLTGGHDVFYTFNRALGSNMVGFAAYFLLSPLNALLLLFPQNAMALFYSVLVLVKIGLCGLTMYVYLQKRYTCGCAGLFFSTAYALCGFMAVYALHVMWLDALVLLPVVVLGIHKIMDGRKPFLYIAALWLTIVCQYYMGYMVCLFAVLYFLYIAGQNHIGFKAFVRKLGVFAGASVLAAGLAAAVLVPTVYTILQGYSLFDFSMLTLEPVNSLFGIFTKVYTASAGVIQLRSGGPNIYIGIPLLVFALLYFACAAIPLRKRLWSLGFAAVFLCSFLFAAPYLVWHALNSPNYFPARFSFLFSFLLIDWAWQGARGIAQSTKRSLTFAAAGIAAAFLALTAVLLSQMMNIEYLALKTVIMDTAFFCAACFLVLWLRKPGRLRTAAIIILCAMQAACLLLNGYYAIVRLNQIWTPTTGEYAEQTERGIALVNRVKTEDDGLYRMELNYHRTDTDPFAYDYLGLTHFSPDADEAVIELFDKLGLQQDYYHIRYAAGTTPVLESLFGLKYILRKDGVAFEPLPDGYEFLWRDGDVSTYKNTFALPYATLAPTQTRELADGDPFVNQNTLLADLTGEETAVFEPMADVERTYDGTWETYTFAVQANRQLYMKSYGTEYVLNGTAESAERMNGTILLPVSYTNTTYTIKMTAPLGIHLAYFDAEAFEIAYAVLAAHAATVESDTDSHLVIHVNVTDAFTQLLITLPFDEGWRVLVDGKQAEATARYGALLAVNLAQGEHTVELRFTPRGLWAGISVSAASFLAVLVWAFWPVLVRRRRRKYEIT